MEGYIQKWGNSLGLRLPAKFAKALKLHSGSQVFIELKENRIIIRTPTYNLEEMLEKITPENRHHLYLEDSSKGEEAW